MTEHTHKWKSIESGGDEVEFDSIKCTVAGCGWVMSIHAIANYATSLEHKTEAFLKEAIVQNKLQVKLFNKIKTYTGELIALDLYPEVQDKLIEILDLED